MFFGHGSVDGAQVDAGLLEGDTGSETAKELGHTVEAVGDHGGGKVMRAGDDVGDDFRILGVRDRGFEHADNGGGAIAHWPAAEPHDFAEDARIFPKSGRPETIGENDDAGSFGTVVLRSDETAEDRVEAHDFEEGAVDNASLNYARLTQADHCELDGRELTERAQGFNAGAQIVNFGHGER